MTTSADHGVNEAIRAKTDCDLSIGTLQYCSVQVLGERSLQLFSWMTTTLTAVCFTLVTSVRYPCHSKSFPVLMSR